ncbi:type 2 lanthipeptide synthetase LanM family protein [Streptosporangium sp. OZ121]|uniref:type 2 lanthipeptide synthetase LanM family protein n=1 Tax=Streptosporangium sp. OZ121 TaxID=3444183 RepID=UPI003F7ACB80
MTDPGARGFTRALDPVMDPAMRDLTDRLARCGLQPSEREVFARATRRWLLDTVRLRLNRVLVVELHAARLTGRLTASDSAARWREFERMAATETFWAHLHLTYPALRARLESLVTGRVRAAAESAERLVADRDRLASLGGDGSLRQVEFGAGDSHQGGRTVARLRFEHGTVMYKPRPLEVDAALAALLDELQDDGAPWIGVPRVVTGRGYGWARFVEHRYCEDEAQVRRFYRGMGWWLALSRLLAGSDLHAENVIAHGPMPVVVDCETLFTPIPPAPSTPLGQATARARDRVARTVAGSLLLPSRATGSPMGGLDMSALGTLAGQQPRVPLPLLEGAGTDQPRLVLKHLDAVSAGQSSHPTANPAPERHVGQLLAGFSEGVSRIDRLDRDGRLRAALERFAGCQVRLVPRATARYTELARALWHPASLRDQPSAVQRVTHLLTTPESGAGPDLGQDVVAAEIGDLLVGDVPMFTLTPETGHVTGPGGVAAGEHGNLIDTAMSSWRALDPALERSVITTSMVNAYLDNPVLHASGPAFAARASGNGTGRGPDHQTRHLDLVTDLATRLCRTAIWGQDGTVTWIGVLLEDQAAHVAPLAEDLYGGQAGVAVALAAYQHAVDRGEAVPVDDLPETLAAAARTLRAMENHWASHIPAGAYIGLGAGIWSWMLLDRLTGLGHAADHARTAGNLLAQRDLGPEDNDVLSGLAGAIAPLIALSEHTGDPVHLGTAVRMATELAARARHHDDGTVSWPGSDDTGLRSAGGSGGLAHGATGIGWALARLGLKTGQEDWVRLAERALAFDQKSYDPARGWRDLQLGVPTYPHTWCRGSVGIGLAHLDLYRRTGRVPHLEPALRAADHVAAAGASGRHDLCHGDLGAWELLEGVRAHRTHHRPWTAHVITSVGEDGPRTGIAADAATPALMTGTSGLLYQLLRMRPGLRLPSVLVMGA